MAKRQKNAAPTPAPLQDTPVTRSMLDTFTPIGFMGYRLDQASGCYILGNGYRLYNPVMRAFYSPDSESPFGKGGISRYHYCYLDPINLYDPTGRFSWWAFGGILLGVLGIVVGILAAIPTGGASLTATAAGFAVVAAATGAAAIGTGVAAFVYEAKGDQDKADLLGKISLGLGGISFGVASIGAAAAPTTAALSLSGGAKLLAGIGGVTQVLGGSTVLTGVATGNETLVKVGAIAVGVGAALSTVGIAPAAISKAAPRTARVLTGPRPAILRPTSAVRGGAVRNQFHAGATGTKYQPPGLGDTMSGVLSKIPHPRVGV
ncbi:RHS repeat-associated core domain-containing protein [Pseudomonas chlororaphis]|uniref:RHS repeat-associated core domain-containing protein n=1 Tax=Pseudomonas chlororaphis TaxID=587753 RepID=UPI0015DF5665|nr:RHS repeat-associated core domain-containing protein [Pseudomonas chlororaphis]QLL16019.1 RHS repeat-associated core domain-containing protein [Pseudomonas chlororaphis subsp. aurantiaca]